MDENQEAVNQTSEENTQVESPATEQIPEEVEQPTEEATAEPDGQTTETEGRPKKGFQSRVNELVKERNEYKDKAQSLEEKLAELTSPVGFQGQQPQYTPQVQPGEELSPEQYQQHVLQTADALVTLKMKQSEAVNRIRNESKDAVRAYPQLDPTSDSFDKELSDTVTEAVEAHVRANPYSASVKGFVDKLMRPYTRAVTKEVGKVTENIAKQVSQTALRPTSVSKGEKSAAEKSIAELERELGVVNS